MVTTRSMARKQKKSNATDDVWSNLDHDLLLLIMMHLGLVDFMAFGFVCKTWRSLAVSNWNKFMVSKQPLYFSISYPLNKKEFYLEDYQSRKLKTTIPHSNGKTCVGVTCGYLIFFERKTCNFWLVNPFTGKELNFLGFPFVATTLPNHFRGILVFSPSMSSLVFVVISHEYANKIAFSLPGEQSGWYCVTSPCAIHDLQFFKGKIYTINWDNQLCELRLNPEPTLTLLKMKNFPYTRDDDDDDDDMMAFVSSSESLFVVDTVGGVYVVYEADFGEMKWVYPSRKIGEHAVFLSDFKCAAAIRPDTWVHPWTQYERLNFADKYGRSQIRRVLSTAYMWYFPHECLIETHSDIINGALLNIMEDQSKKVGESSCSGLGGISNAEEGEENT